MSGVPASSHAGGNTTAEVVASGKVLPVGAASGVTLDTTTYPDGIRGGAAKLATLVFATDGPVLGVALQGDAFPRLVLDADATNFGLSLGNGAIDPLGANGVEVYFSANGVMGVAASIVANPALNPAYAPSLQQVSPRFTITSGALPTVAPVSGTAFQCSTPGIDRDVTLVVPFTGDATNNAATLLIQLSPDNVTFSTLDTLSIAAALNLTGAINVPVTLAVPAAWYVKLTATHGTIGTGTYY